MITANKYFVFELVLCQFIQNIYVIITDFVFMKRSYKKPKIIILITKL